MEQETTKSSFKRWAKRYFSVTLVVVIGVICYILFFNDNSVTQTYKHRKEISRLKSEILALKDSLEKYETLNAKLDTNGEELERIVREEYHMQRPDEDVYIFE